MDKTNAMRILDRAKIDYKVYEYEHSEGFVDGESVARRLNQDVGKVFKTIVTVANTREYLVVMLPVNKEIDLKAVARVFNVKSVEMINVKDITKVTGYIRGGCSPVGMKKQFRTVIDNSALQYDTFIFSAGKIGMQVEIPVRDIERVANVVFEAVTQ